MDDARALPAIGTAAWSVELVDRVPAGREALDLVNGACATAIAHHSARTLRYALHIADRAQVDVDRTALVHACLLHDLGASDLAVGTERFEVRGADLAVALLAEHGWRLSGASRCGRRSRCTPAPHRRTGEPSDPAGAPRRARRLR